MFTYYQSNRWKILNRTDLRDEENEDPTTWGIDRILREIDHRLQLALEEGQALQKISVETFDGLLEKGALEKSFRPTLYDFIAHEASSFYQLEETNGPKPKDSFTFDSNSPALASVEEFLAWKPDTDQSPKGRALALYQDLLRLSLIHI